MGSFRKWVVALSVLAVPVFAAAGTTLLLAGGVYEDHGATALRANFAPVSGVTLRLYRDDGDHLPGAHDPAVATATTGAGGLYVFRLDRPGDYWVTVDSHTFPQKGAWPEQTFGPSGSLCTRTAGEATLAFEGACFGGRRANISDSASALETAEHVAAVPLRESVSNVDFALSYDAVTNTLDGDAIQGSLRQFFLNANAEAGPNRMRFVPLEPAPLQRDEVMGVPVHWWKITLGAPLPPLRDADTVIDGAAFNSLSPTSAANANPGRLGESPTMKIGERSVERIDRPELEIVTTGSEGIACEARCGIRSASLHGSPAEVAVRADMRIEDTIVGAAPDAAAVPGGTIGLEIEKGSTIARRVLVTSQSRGGVIVGPGARLDAEHLDVSRCGDPQTGGGIVLLSDGSTVRASIVTANQGVGVLIGSAEARANANTIDGCTISGNQAGVVFSAGSSRNVISRNEIMWNRIGGVTVAPFDPAAAPRQNRITANRFDENGLRPIVLDLEAENPNALRGESTTCDRLAATPNEGIRAPHITWAHIDSEAGAYRVTLRGRACAGEIVEIYQSYITSEIHVKEPDVPLVRDKNGREETISGGSRELELPSIGEFNYLGAAVTGADGAFEASFPLPAVTVDHRNSEWENHETDIWAADVLRGALPNERAFSGIAIDSLGNTSEMSVRRHVE